MMSRISFSDALLKSKYFLLAMIASGENPDGSPLSHGMVDGSLTPKGYQRLADLSAVRGLAVPESATLALMQAEGSGIRYRDDGPDPTANAGMPIPAGGSLFYNGDLSAFRVVQETAGAILNVSYYA